MENKLMNQKFFSTNLLICTCLVIIVVAVYYFIFPSSTVNVLSNPDERLKSFTCKDLSQFSEANRKSIEESKNAIVLAGISNPYFEQHFCPVIVEVVSPSTRVLWKYSVNDYQLIFEDSFVNGVHNILQNVKPLHDIVSTISKETAKKLVESCTGPNVSSYLFTFGPLNNLGSRLHVVASSNGELVPNTGSQSIKIAKVDLESGKVYCEEDKISSGPR
jgi:hypothetical protein